MPPSAFPVNPSGKPYLRFVMLADEWPVTEGPVYYDGGRDTFCAATEPTRRWLIVFGGLTPAQAAVLDAHFASAKGTHLGFNLTWRDGTVYANVKYESYERNHPFLYDYSQSRAIQLIKRP